MRRLTLALAVSLALAVPATAAAARGVSIFYYPWYGTPQRDGGYLHWDQDGHVPPADLASSYYPTRGPYSSSDPAVLRAQMREIAAAEISEVVSSWWGWGSPEDVRLPDVMRAASVQGLSVAVQLEPYEDRTAASVKADIDHLRDLGITRVYVYRPFDIDPASWKALAERAAGVELLAQTGNVAWAAAAGFDGVYTYDIVEFGSRSLGRLCARAHAAGLICAPSVGPGYEALRATGDPRARPRRGGATYDAMWVAVIHARADRVTITSYNEWHEGTQIEPALTPLPRRLGASPVRSAYSSYDGTYGLRGRAAERAYLERTALWARVYGLVSGAVRVLEALTDPSNGGREQG